MNRKTIDAIIGKRYKAAPGAQFNDKQAQIIGAEFEGMQAENLPITPPNLVDRARPDESPIHPHFEWQDPIAAELYRQQQARSLMNHLVVIHQTTRGEQEQKAIFSVVVHREEEDAQREYISVTQVHENAEFQAQLEAEAWGELASFARKYSALGFKDFSPVFEFVKANEQIERISHK